MRFPSRSILSFVTCATVVVCCVPRSRAQKSEPFDLWSLKPIQKVAPPDPSGNPIDAFIRAKLAEKGLAPSPESDRRTLIRRVSYDLVGLPPTPDEVDAFVKDSDPHAYEKLVDRLLASPGYGERWARHWLDCVHYGDTHGYDKDKVREHAWPYRDYVIRALNEDKPYDRFVKEQLAGDFFYPNTADGIAALGFLAAGPWDYVGQAEVRDGTMEKARVRNIDRDDMVMVTMNTFVSLTAQCARCHNHKFDPISQEDYYSLQTVFSAVDRADRAFDSDASVASKRKSLARRRAELAALHDTLDAKVKQACGPELASLDLRIYAAALRQPPEYGYHSAIETRQNAAKWVQVDLGTPTRVDRVVLHACNDAFNDIGPGFGFPVRYEVEACDDATFSNSVHVLADHTASDVKNPRLIPVELRSAVTARFIRVTATKLAPRQNDYIFALAELEALSPDGTNAALHKPVTSLDAVDPTQRWARQNLVDGIFPGVKETPELKQLHSEREALLAKHTTSETRSELERSARELKSVDAARAALPAPTFVVFAAATDFEPNGEFRPTFGTPREIHLLQRGMENAPRQVVGPGSVGAVKELPSRFELATSSDESARRAALADWVLDARNPLTWRSIVNRVWHYHFGRGIVDTPNDFGHMGGVPSHPELLDYLAADFRDTGRSLKRLHRLIVTSRTYRQSSASNADFAKVDGNNQYLWRQNRQRLDSEAVRDSVLSAAGLLDRKAGGPGFKCFGFEDDHSPRYKYAEYDPDDPVSHRRSIYRLIVRSVPDPFMETLDCADPSQVVERRNETLTALQALSMLNNRFMVRMSEHFAERVAKVSPDLREQLTAACLFAESRRPSDEELSTLMEVARKHGLPSACRLIFNTNEFAFID